MIDEKLWSKNFEKSGEEIVTDSGLTIIKHHKSESNDKPKKGEIIQVHYKGFLDDGTVFDSSIPRGKPFEFPLGQGRVIKGWDEGFENLEVSDKATLVIPPELGYGERGAGGRIPPNATLFFQVELVGIPAFVKPRKRKELPGQKATSIS